MIIDEGVYLAHYGKKGMRWGVRGRSEKVAIAGAAAVGGAVGAHLTKYLRTPLRAAAAGAFAVGGAKMMASAIDHHGAKKVSELTKSGGKANPNDASVAFLGNRKSRKADKKDAKADTKWQKNIYSVHGAIAVHNRTADRLNSGALAELNSKHTSPIKVGPRGEMDMTHPATRKYVHDYQQLVAHHTAQAIKDVHGKSPSGKFEAKLDTSDKHNWKVKVAPTVAKHGIEGLDAFKPSPGGTPTAPELLMEVEHTANNKVASHKRIK